MSKQKKSQEMVLARAPSGHVCHDDAKGGGGREEKRDPKPDLCSETFRHLTFCARGKQSKGEHQSPSVIVKEI